MKELSAIKHQEVCFSEVDSMGIVWHGNYVKYLEDAREAFGAKYHFGYLDMHREGFYAPIVRLDIQFRRPLAYGESFDVEIKYVPCRSAKLMFEYTIVESRSGECVLTATSTQALTGLDHEQIYYPPEYVVQWRKDNGVEVE